jgi:hypothetical protein
MLALLATHGQVLGTDVFLADFFLLSAPLLLLWGLLGGLFGGYLRIGLLRLFSASIPEATAEQIEETQPEQERREPLVSPRRRLWGSIWRLAIAGVVGVLVTMYGISIFLTMYFSLNQVRAPLFDAPSLIDVLLGLLTLILLVLSLLVQHDFWQQGQ